MKTTTTSTIRGKLNSLKMAYNTGAITDNDLIILYFSAHGDRQDSTFFIKPTDYQAGLIETGITGATIQKYLGADVKCKKILFMDVCKSGSINEKFDDEILIQSYKKLQQGLSNWVIFTSSDDNSSYESSKHENGLFTYALKEALSGGLADENKDNLISIQELYEYLKKRIPILCTEIPNFQSPVQQPQLINNTLPPSMPIFQLKK